MALNVIKGSKVFTILISGSRAPIALEMARSFHLQGHRVVMVDSMIINILSAFTHHLHVRFLHLIML